MARGSAIPMALVSTSASPLDWMRSMRMLLLLSTTRGTNRATPGGAPRREGRGLRGAAV